MEQTWTITITKDPNFLAPRNSAWTKVCEMAGEDTIPGLVLAYSKHPRICMPFWVYDSSFPRSNNLTVVLALKDWVEKIKEL